MPPRPRKLAQQNETLQFTHSEQPHHLTMITKVKLTVWSSVSK